MVKTRFGLLDTVESIPLETKKRLKKKYNSDEQGGNDKKYVETTYSELKSLRDEGKLVPGALYRITDYVTTTEQNDTISAGHQFDIIVQALSESVLSEDAKAIKHNYTFPETIIGVTLYAAIMQYKGNYIKDNVSYLKYEDKENNIYLINPKKYRNDNGEQRSSPENIICKHSYNPDFVHYSSSLDSSEFEDGTEAGEQFGTNKPFPFDYFSNSNLAAWKLKYCLDNDEERFAWAKNLYLSPVSHKKCIRVREIDDDAGTAIYVRYPEGDNDEYGCAWAIEESSGGITIKEYSEDFESEELDYETTKYTKSENVYIGEICTNSSTTEITDFSEQGKGVIYQMIDEYGNNCPYDFKNIQFLRSQGWHSEHTDWTEEVIGENPNKDIYYFTFSWINSDYSVEDVSVVGKNNDTDTLMHAENNIINVYVDEMHYYQQLYLNNIILVSSYNTDNEIYYGTINNIFRYGCRDCTFGDKINNNIFDTAFVNNIMTNNILGNKSFGNVYDIDEIPNVNKQIIYMDSDYTIHFKDINDAFSGT